MKAATLATLALLASALPGPVPLADPLPRTPGLPYQVQALPDRILLTPGADPARSMAISYRTDASQVATEIQLAPALAGPQLEGAARTLRFPGGSRSLQTANGLVRYHQAHLDGLTPDQAYAYRVRGPAGWSEWLQFRTAATESRPFRFIYLGDVQNDILSLASRTVRQALHRTADPALVVHAGDLVSQRDDLDHDDEWGEWHQAGGFHYAQVPQLVATGNHEYVDHLLENGEESRRLGPHWPLQFALPDNGAPGAASTTYRVDYQGVRFVVLDGTSALDLGTLESQTRWLTAQLQDSPADWNIVVMHQPLYTCARPNDTEPLTSTWAPILQQHGVDLVLQGHDHCYSRLSRVEGRAAAADARARGLPQAGPVYMVSVAGAKMYGLNDRADRQPDRAAEGTQLYQVIEVSRERLQVRSHTADGALYDAFDLVRTAEGRSRLQEPESSLPAERRCRDGQGPDGQRCMARPK